MRPDPAGLRKRYGIRTRGELDAAELAYLSRLRTGCEVAELREDRSTSSAVL